MRRPPQSRAIRPPCADAHSDGYLTPERVRALRNALRRVEGHVRAVSDMVEQRRCADELLTQLSAIRAAISRVTAKVIEDELLACLSWWDARDPAEAEQRFQRSMAAVTRMLKRS